MRLDPRLRKLLLLMVGAIIVRSGAAAQQLLDPNHSASSAAPCIACMQAGQTPGSPSSPGNPPDQQTPDREKKDDNADKTVTIKSVFLNLPRDQKAIWTSPARLHVNDAVWLAPTVAGFGVLIGSDRHSLARARSNADAISTSDNLANGGLGVMIGVPAAMWAVGSWSGNAHERETGLLAGEAVINSFAITEALKAVFARQRPLVIGGDGKFFKDPGNGSFPSAHAMLSWTAASVLVHEYPGILTQILAYGTAGAVSVSRVTGRHHFPSDVVVGSALGWFIGHEVYERRHDPALENPPYGSFMRDSKEFDPDQLGSAFVPLDSWVYPALERLAALGYITSQFTGLRPWTRRECMRQTDEAGYMTQDLPPESEIVQTVQRLRDEFKDDGQSYTSLSVDSVYMRYMNISSEPLRNSYHIGDTIWNDYGRPFDQGNNLYTGAVLCGGVGRLFWYASGEYEHAPGRPALTQAQQNLITGMDLNPSEVPAPVATTDRFYPLDMYAGLQLDQWALTFGKESMWFGPGESGPLMLSDNADPMYTLRLTRTTPLILPSFLRHLGEIRAEFLFSKLSGHQFPARPFFNLQKISLHPTKNLEIGFTRASLWAGVGHPFTAHSLERNLTANGDSGVGVSDPGDRKSGFDFSYRLPGLRNWLTLYSDSYSDDDPSPLANPRRSAINPGLYLSHFPIVSRLDLRVEAVSTQSLTSTDRGPTFLYFNTSYHDSNTNKGYIFGNQTGRDGRTYQAWSTYHLSASTSLQFGYRDTKLSKAVLSGGLAPGGGTQSDGSTRLRWQVRPDWNLDAIVQYERWFIPALHPTAQHDVATSIQISFTPHLKNLLPSKN
ncbi:MAG TPA: capsule assembly Wzi family protein [Candidatus Angelobacter sp.]|nr:capsule assembly Wzi family protein [Candidatus Angelobacter sp.]